MQLELLIKASQDYFKEIIFNLNKKKLLGYFVVDEAHWYVVLRNIYFYQDKIALFFLLYFQRFTMGP
jgi:hypothetical protein